MIQVVLFTCLSWLTAVLWRIQGLMHSVTKLVWADKLFLCEQEHCVKEGTEVGSFPESANALLKLGAKGSTFKACFLIIVAPDA